MSVFVVSGEAARLYEGLPRKVIAGTDEPMSSFTQAVLSNRASFPVGLGVAHVTGHLF